MVDEQVTTEAFSSVQCPQIIPFRCKTVIITVEALGPKALEPLDGQRGVLPSVCVGVEPAGMAFRRIFFDAPLNRPMVVVVGVKPARHYGVLRASFTTCGPQNSAQASAR